MKNLLEYLEQGCGTQGERGTTKELQNSLFPTLNTEPGQCRCLLGVRIPQGS